MDSPTLPVNLEKAQVEELCRHFSSFRHDVNGCLALVVAATELIRYNPAVLARMANTLVEQPPKIAGKLQEFVQQCERVIGVRPATEAAWYPPLWKRLNAAADAPANSVSLTPEIAKDLHGELVQLGKELTQLGFVISGTRLLTTMNPANAIEAMPNVAEQFTKAALKYELLITHFEQVAQISETGASRLGGGAPAGPVALTAEHVALFHRRLMNLQRDLLEHLQPLLELSRLARQSPQDLQKRANEFSQASPDISAVIANFAAEFDRTFNIARAAQPA